VDNIREQFKDHVSKSAFKVVDGVTRIIGKYGEIEQIDGEYDIYFVGPERTPLSTVRINSLPKRNKSGIIGVCWHKRDKKWRATIWANKKLTVLGNYETIFDAAAARIKANKKYGYHPNHGK